jgi:hypothetical protein
MDRKLYQDRKRDKVRAERLAAGEPLEFTKSFTKDVRTKITWAMLDSVPSKFKGSPYSPGWDAVGGHLQRILFKTWGRTTGLTKISGIERNADVSSYLINDATDEEALDMVEAWFDAVIQAVRAVKAEEEFIRFAPDWKRMVNQSFDAYRNEVNSVLDLHDVGYQVIDTEVIERESMAMHADVVEPALALLHGDSRLASVERAFQDALRELKPGGNPADAITDAATALQEMLVAIGADGNALGPLMRDGVSRGLLRPYDAKLVDWASASRSDRGDAHSAGEASSSDAWLVVHVVGALILRLEAALRNL